VIASKSGNLDDYIDGLLNSPPPIVAPPDAGPVISTDDAGAGAGAGVGVGVSVGVGGGGAGIAAGDQVIVAGDNEGSSISTHDKFRLVEPEAAGPKVETFAMSTQTEEDHFPIQKNESDDDDDANKDDDDEDEHKNNDEEEDKENKENVSVASSFLPEPKLLSPDQVNKEVANKQFSTFFTSASKKVERLLGANILSDLLVDDSTYSKPSDNSTQTTTTKLTPHKKEKNTHSSQHTYPSPSHDGHKDATSHPSTSHRTTVANSCSHPTTHPHTTLEPTPHPHPHHPPNNPTNPTRNPPRCHYSHPTPRHPPHLDHDPASR